ncbi:MAG: hypothetical protein IPM39_24280 [Chloroflexi bacterium]|nr:hypothetical protein [Chloroflexota bacterium]
MKNRLFLFAGILSFVSAFFVVAGLLISYLLTPLPPQDLRAIEAISRTFIFLFAPILLLPTILAVYRLLVQDFPLLALVSLILGQVGFGGLLIWSFLTAFLLPADTANYLPVLYVELMLIGLWTLITAAALLVFESKNLIQGNRRSFLYGFLFLSGLVGGIALILYGWNLLRPLSMPSAANYSILIWLASYPLWLIGLGASLLTYSREPALLLPGS